MVVDSGISAEEFSMLKMRYEKEEKRLKKEIRSLSDANANLEDECAEWK